jgi:hypothetical protein
MAGNDELESIRREIAQLRELLEEKIQALDDVISCRLEAMDKALELAQREDTLAHLAQRFEDMVLRLSRLEKDKARSRGID